MPMQTTDRPSVGRCRSAHVRDDGGGMNSTLELMVQFGIFAAVAIPVSIIIAGVLVASAIKKRQG